MTPMGPSGAVETDLGTLFNKLAGLRSDAERISFVRRRRGRLVCPDVVEQLADEIRKRVRVDIQNALQLAEGAVIIANELGDPGARALSLRAKANALFMLGQNRESVALHEQAIGLFRECGNTIQLGRSLSASIQPLSHQGKYDRAFAMVAEARAIFSAQGDSLRLARLDINFANILFRQDQFLDALTAYERACDVLWPDKDIEGIAVVLHNIAVCLTSLNELQRARGAYSRAREFCDRHNMPLLALQADYNIAYLHYLRGEYRRAIDSLLAVREVCRSVSDHQHFALCHLDLSEIYLELNLSTEAAHMAQDAFLQFQELGMGYEAAKSLSNHAIALSQQGKAPSAIDLFTRARKLFVKEKNPFWPAVIDLYQALVFFNAGKDLEAKRLCESACECFKGSALSAKVVLSQLLLARLALRSGDSKNALSWCSKAIRRAYKLESPNLEYQSSIVMGNILEAMGSAAEACQSYETAHRIMEALRSSLGADELKVAFMTNKFEVYERLVSICLDGISSPSMSYPERSLPERALVCIEQAKSRGLRDLVFGRLHDLQVRMEGKSDALGCIRELREELNWFYRRIESQELGQLEAPAKRIEELREQARDRERQFARLLRERSNGMHEVLESSVATLEEIRAALPADATLIEYFRIRDRLIAVVLTRERLDIHPLAEVSRIVPSLRMLQFQMAKLGRTPDNGGAAVPVIQGHLRVLYEEILAPMRDRLNECRRLVIVPHDVLHYVPFQALMDGDKYLVDSFSISYAPSASVFALCRTRQAQSASRSLVMGVPDEKSTHIRDEVFTIAGLLPNAELHLAEQATFAILKEKGESSRFIHIATHGHFRQDNPLFSSVRLGDGHLNVYDLYDLRLPAQLITLSGCGTGLSVLAKGDELLGLERGLLYAGAQAVLLAMWNVNDFSTSQFMARFYQRLSECQDPAEALRTTAMEHRDRYPNPYYWAPFKLVGNGFGVSSCIYAPT